MSTELPGSGRRVSDPEADPGRAVAELLREVAGGHGDAFESLHELIAPRIFNVAMSVVRDVDHAQEVCQEVFLEIWRRAGKFDNSRGNAVSWVVTLARSRAVDRVRQAQASRVRDNTYAHRTFEPDIDDVVDEVMRRGEQLQLRSALAELSTLQREAIMLTFFTGHSYPEASRILGVPLSTLKARMRDALSALRRASAIATD